MLFYENFVPTYDLFALIVFLFLRFSSFFANVKTIFDRLAKDFQSICKRFSIKWRNCVTRSNSRFPSETFLKFWNKKKKNFHSWKFLKLSLISERKRKWFESFFFFSSEFLYKIHFNRVQWKILGSWGVGISASIPSKLWTNELFNWTVSPTTD